MKQFDLVKLVNEKPYKQNNLNEGDHGIVINIMGDNLQILFFNPQNIGDYIVVDIKVNDVILEKEKLPINIIQGLSKNLAKIVNKAKSCFEPIKIKQYDKVELLVEEERYAKHGIHKGDIGCVMESTAVQNYIEVDFSGIDENGEFYGESIGVKVDDLKIIN